MTALMNPDRMAIVGVLKKAGGDLPFSSIAKDAKLIPQVALAHLDVLEQEGLVKSHWGKPSVSEGGKWERCFELTDKIPQAVEEMDKLVKPLRV